MSLVRFPASEHACPTKWMVMPLNHGVDLATNQNVIPSSVFTEISMTTAHSMMYGMPRDTFTFIGGYGMGWMRSTFQGHDVRCLQFRVLRTKTDDFLCALYSMAAHFQGA